MKNQFGVTLDRNGYAPSILQPSASEGRGHCALCGRTGGKLDRHEPWGGANRRRSKELGMWVLLCHLGCHEGPGSVHDDPELARQMRKDAQRAAMLRYGWGRAEFYRAFGKNELSDAEAGRLLTSAAGAARAGEALRAHREGFRVLPGEMPY